MILVNNHVYCCGGINDEILNSCERFDVDSLLQPECKGMWTRDVPDMKQARFSMTMILVDRHWIYSFGGANEGMQI